METFARATQRGLGLAVTSPREVIFAAASAALDAGYSSFWLNNPPQTNALESLGAVARVVHDIHLGVGIIPLSAQGPGTIARDVLQHALPLDRFYLGVGSGSGASGLSRVADGLRELRTQLEVSIVVAALGPKMCRLAGAQADGVLLNWLTPEYARQSIEWVHAAAQGAGHQPPRLMAYVRVALGAGARSRLEREASNYEAIPHYAAHFQRMGTSAMGSSIAGDSVEEIQRRLAAWDGVVDEVVVRAIVADSTPAAVEELIQAAALGR